MELSIVIPAYDENRKIAGDIKVAADFMVAHNLKGEIIVVDDGSTDKTADTAKNVKVPSDIKLEVVRYESHRGKGYAVRKGIERTKGTYVMFADSGLCVPYDNTLRGL
jgi:dolichyl-phosphate beta-glucosyltransferase